MYTIQINHDDYPAELSPACEVFTSAHVSEAAAVWQFMIDNLRPGWRVTLLDVAGDVVKTAEATEPYSHHRQPATGSHDKQCVPRPDRGFAITGTVHPR